jgi:hypothetical protein
MFLAKYAHKGITTGHLRPFIILHWTVGRLADLCSVFGDRKSGSICGCLRCFLLGVSICALLALPAIFGVVSVFVCFMVFGLGLFLCLSVRVCVWPAGVAVCRCLAVCVSALMPCLSVCLSAGVCLFQWTMCQYFQFLNPSITLRKEHST